MHEHAGWRIGVSPFPAEGRWFARIEVWSPGTGPRTHSGMALPFAGRFGSAHEAEAVAFDQAKRWIERQLS